jgi:hypothetical protein
MEDFHVSPPFMSREHYFTVVSYSCFHYIYINYVHKMQPRREAHDSRLSRMHGVTPPLPHMPSWHVAELNTGILLHVVLFVVLEPTLYIFLFRFSLADNSSGLGSEPSMVTFNVQAVANIRHSKRHTQHCHCRNSLLSTRISEVPFHRQKGGRGCASAETYVRS